LVWLKFLFCLAIILVSGIKLSRYGDAIAEKTGLGGIWIGLLLIAAITSMPELVTGVSAAALVGSADLAVGTLFGSNMLNLAVIALLDVLSHPVPVLTRASPGHIASAGLMILLVAIAAGAISAGDRISWFALGWLGVPAIIILVVYLVGVRGIFHLERRRRLGVLPAGPLRYEEISRRATYIKFTLAAVAIIGAGIWLSFIGDEIAQVTGWSATFAGSLFLAITTSLPEVVVAVSALRLGAIDMGVAAMLGSNMFNMAIIAPVDLAYTKGSILSLVSPEHIITALVVIAMGALVIAGLRWRTKRMTFAVMSWYTPGLIGLYIFGAYALFISLRL
jgi:cation:H+ antiporter